MNSFDEDKKYLDKENILNLKSSLEDDIAFEDSPLENNQNIGFKNDDTEKYIHKQDLKDENLNGAVQSSDTENYQKIDYEEEVFDSDFSFNPIDYEQNFGEDYYSNLDEDNIYQSNIDDNFDNGIDESQEKPNNMLLAKVIVSLTVVFIISTIFNNLKGENYFFGRYVVTEGRGSSMEPTIPDKSKLKEDMKIYKKESPKQMDIIVLAHICGLEELYLCKRIIAVENQTVDYRHGWLYVDDVRLEAGYLAGLSSIPAGDRLYPVHLGKGEYFVLGDNVLDSHDSRDYEVSNVKIENIKSKVVNSFE